MFSPDDISRRCKQNLNDTDPPQGLLSRHSSASTSRHLPYRAVLLSAIITTLIAAPSVATAFPTPVDDSGKWADFVINPADGSASPAPPPDPPDAAGDDGHINSLPFPRNMYAPAARAIPSGLLLGMLFTIIIWAAMCVLRSVTRRRRRAGAGRAGGLGGLWLWLRMLGGGEGRDPRQIQDYGRVATPWDFAH
ncbi:hypothetical protein B0H67DRAFT_658499 [Lasiosphaeris hirsuta]|uniref:Uncharacterized protein n=1 Tax=Lasiosphaeris hirsuta TaxID=260670 RepID=A0AA40B014_9PEZI|nr:hypothetical protein B0H67DRAFT_658499 [Lasiosphaeris hirsuta]